MLDYDVSLHDLVVLVIIFETSPSSSKTELGCSSYDCFRIGVSISFSKTGDSGGRTPETPVLNRNLRFESCVTAASTPGQRLGGVSGPGDSGAATVTFWRAYLRGPSSPMNPNLFLSLSPPLLTFKKLDFLPIPPMILAYS